MDRQAAKEQLKKMEPDFLTRLPKNQNGHASYICPNPNCENGKGKDGTGIAWDIKSNDGHYTCFKCGLHEDIIGLWMIHTGTSNYSEAFKSLYEYYGIHIDGSTTPTEKKYNKASPSPKSQPQPQPKEDKERPNYTDYFKVCKERINQTDYPQKRGLSKDVVERFNLGYDPHYKVKGGQWEVLIIPTGLGSYVARNMDSNADKNNRYRKQNSSLIYNRKALTEAQKPIFIVEGELDCLSILSVGGEATALSSTANWKSFIKIVEDKKPVQPLIIALDNDSTGEKTANDIIAELERLKISFYRINVYGECKDANEALTTDRETFKNAVFGAIAEVELNENKSFEEQKEAYLKTSAGSHIQEFLNGIADSANTPCISTGFKKLDKELDGGLYEGLIFMGGLSSVGKTTLALQISDQIAKSGHDVLIISLEMSRTELMSKSISRLTLMDILEHGGNIGNAKTSRGITAGARYTKYSKAEIELIQKATNKYAEYADHIFIHEGVGNIGVAKIREIVKNHIFITGKKPVLIVDYIQILSPPDERLTEKQAMDKSVLELKRISRDYKIPVIGISSFNRANYKTAVAMDCFKESGSIEYSSDILLGLQLKGAGENGFKADEEKKKNPRNIELVILKNRNGKTGEKVEFEYYPLFNYIGEK